MQVIRRSPTGRMEVIGGRMEDIQVVWRSYGGRMKVIQVVWRSYGGRMEDIGGHT